VKNSLHVLIRENVDFLLISIYLLSELFYMYVFVYLGYICKHKYNETVINNPARKKCRKNIECIGDNVGRLNLE